MKLASSIGKAYHLVVQPKCKALKARAIGTTPTNPLTSLALQVDKKVGGRTKTVLDDGSQSHNKITQKTHPPTPRENWGAQTKTLHAQWGISAPIVPKQKGTMKRLEEVESLNAKDQF